MKVSELTKLLKENGCMFEEHRGEHDFWFSPLTSNHIQIPRHPSKELPIGTLHKILRDAGLK